MPALEQVLVLCDITPQQRAALEQALPGAAFTYRAPGEATGEELAAAQAIFGNPDPALLRQAARLRFLQLVSAGTEGYTAPGVLPEGVLLANATGSYGLAISEYMLGVLLSLSKKLHLYRDQQHRAVWQSLGEVRPILGSTVLVVGLGDIGGEFARRVKAMGAFVIGVRRRGTDRPDFVDELYLSDRLDELLPRADVVALCLPGTADTRGLMSRGRIGRMKRGAILINVGRGSAVDAGALCDALDEGRLWGAALDVADPEPQPADSRLWTTENLILTPHVSGGYTLPETLNRVVRLAAQNLAAFSEGRPVQSAVDLETGYRRL